MKGTRIGNYELGEKLGAGGMGEVYRATDTRLQRAVAIKLLPESFVSDPERVARFDREAKTLASLNHPNIAAIYGLEEGAGRTAIIMELVEGEDLSDRVARGAIPVTDALDIARQLAEGLEEAHSRGVVHRDLKPANIKLTPDGQVKILDFGLARAFSGEAVDEEPLSNSPTITAMTQQGVILGTAAYMSPEQSRGKPVDKRSDMWAFGVILYEMLTGQQLFKGETVSDTVAGILRQEFDWDVLPPDTPAATRRLLRRCLERDPKLRLRSAGDALLELLEPDPVEEVRTVPPRGRSWLPWAIGAMSVLLAIAAWTLRPGTSTVESQAIQFDVLPPDGESLVNAVLSPDGKTLAVITRKGDALPLYVRPLGDPVFTPTSGPDAPNLEHSGVFWSPDSRRIGYFTSSSRIASISPETKLSEVIYQHNREMWPRGASWGDDGTILFAPDPNSPILRVPASGGNPIAVTELDSTIADVSHRWPVWLPGGTHFLYTLWSNSAEVLANEGGVYLGSISGDPPVKLLDDDSACHYAEPGFLLVHRSRNLVAIPFDPKTLRVTGDARIAGTDVGFQSANGAVMANASKTGTVAWIRGVSRSSAERLVWVGPDGSLGPDLPFVSGSDFGVISPDSRSIALAQYASANEVGTVVGIWIADLEKGTPQRITRGPEDAYSVIWSPDSRQIAYAMRAQGTETLFLRNVRSVDPGRQFYFDPTRDATVDSWSPDGQHIFFTTRSKSGGQFELLEYSVAGDSTRFLFGSTEYDQEGATISPDGRWLAYFSNESGTHQVYVRPYPELHRKWQVSSALVGSNLYWRADGKALAYEALVDDSRVVLQHA